MRADCAPLAARRVKSQVLPPPAMRMVPPMPVPPSERGAEGTARDSAHEAAHAEHAGHVRSSKDLERLRARALSERIHLLAASQGELAASMLDGAPAGANPKPRRRAGADANLPPVLAGEWDRVAWRPLGMPDGRSHAASCPALPKVQRAGRGAGSRKR